MAFWSVINGNKLLSDSLAVYGSEKIIRREDFLVFVLETIKTIQFTIGNKSLFFFFQKINISDLRDEWKTLEKQSFYIDFSIGHKCLPKIALV